MNLKKCLNLLYVISLLFIIAAAIMKVFWNISFGILLYIVVILALILQGWKSNIYKLNKQ